MAIPRKNTLRAWKNTAKMPSVHNLDLRQWKVQNSIYVLTEPRRYITISCTVMSKPSRDAASHRPSATATLAPESILGKEIALLHGSSTEKPRWLPDLSGRQTKYNSWSIDQRKDSHAHRCRQAPQRSRLSSFPLSLSLSTLRLELRVLKERAFRLPCSSVNSSPHSDSANSTLRSNR